MKRIYLFLSILAILAPIATFAQFSTSKTTTTNPAIKSQNISNSRLNTSIVKAGKLDKLEPPKSLTEKEISSFPIVKFSPEDLNRTRQKYWELTPRKPYETGMELTHWGTFTNSAFLMTPVIRYIINTDYDYYTYTTRISVNLVAEKDYKLILGIEPKSFPAGSTVIFKVGNSQFRIEWPSNKNEIQVLFNNSFSGQQIIEISPVQIPNKGRNLDAMQEFAVKSIRLEELAN